MSQIINAMTVDVEDYFHVSAFENTINKSDWNQLPLRVEQNTYRLLELFEKHGVKSTFFTLGWVAERCPNLIKAIVDQGHEIASHGFAHQRITEMTKESFIADVEKSKNILEQLSGTEVIGYRAPSFSINDSNTWVYEKLIELGFEYSSSTYPIQHDLYGVPSWPRFMYERPESVNGKKIIEIPIPTLCKNNVNTGIGGFDRTSDGPVKANKFALCAGLPVVRSIFDSPHVLFWDKVKIRHALRWNVHGGQRFLCRIITRFPFPLSHLFHNFSLNDTFSLGNFEHIPTVFDNVLVFRSLRGYLE